jgi:hypothetical protein
MRRVGLTFGENGACKITNDDGGLIVARWRHEPFIEPGATRWAIDPCGCRFILSPLDTVIGWKACGDPTHTLKVMLAFVVAFRLTGDPDALPPTVYLVHEVAEVARERDGEGEWVDAAHQ